MSNFSVAFGIGHGGLIVLMVFSVPILPEPTINQEGIFSDKFTPSELDHGVSGAIPDIPGYLSESRVSYRMKK